MRPSAAARASSASRIRVPIPSPRPSRRNDEEESSLIRVLPELDSLDYDSHWLNEGAYPAPAKAIETNYRCMMNTRLALDFYRGRETADTVLELSSVDIVGRPFSNIEGNSTESILLRWGRKDAVEAFKRHKMLE